MVCVVGKLFSRPSSWLTLHGHKGSIHGMVGLNSHDTRESSRTWVKLVG